jgi:hypothetical protein
LKLPVEREAWLVALLLGSVAAMACFQSSDGDLGFHLATGREILATGRIPSRNVLSFAEPEHAWLLHQWLPALLFEWLWQRWGVVGVISAKMLVVTTTWAVAYRTARVLQASASCAAVACMLAACASAFRFEVRPYLFTHLTLALTLLAVAQYGRASTARERRSWLTFAGLCVVVGSQLHAGAIDSVLVMVLFAFGSALEPWRARLLERAPQSPHGLAAAVVLLTTAVVGSAVAALCLALYHPWGARVLAFPFEMAAQRYWGEHLVEFRHAWAFPWLVLLAYWLWLAVLAVTLPWTARALHAGWLAMLLAYAAISLGYVRMVYAFGLISAPLAAASWSAWVKPWDERTALARACSARVVGAVTLAVLACAGPLYVYRDHTAGFGLAAWVWPLDHFAFIRERRLQGRAFVSDAWAGPFLGIFYPERKVFFDDRLEAYSEAFAQRVYQRIRYGRPGWDQLLDRYRIDIVLLRYTTAGEARLQRAAPNLRQHLARDSRYSLVRFDDMGELFVRATPANAMLIAHYAVAGVDPDRRVFLQRPASCVAQLLRASQRGYRSNTLLGLTALALADAGDTLRANEVARMALERAPDDSWLSRVRVQVASQTRR